MKSAQHPYFQEGAGETTTLGGGVKMKRPRSRPVGKDVSLRQSAPDGGADWDGPFREESGSISKPNTWSTQSNSPRQAGLQGPSVCAHSSAHSGSAHKQEGTESLWAAE